jgi:hypothetical protein
VAASLVIGAVGAAMTLVPFHRFVDAPPPALPSTPPPRIAAAATTVPPEDAQRQVDLAAAREARLASKYPEHP